MVIGHADGTLTGIDDGMVMDDEIYTNQPGPIESISATEPGFLVAVAIESGSVGAGFGGAEGLARAYDENGKLLWQVETTLGRNVEHVMFGPPIKDTTSAWVTSWDDRQSNLDVYSVSDGELIFRTTMKSRINAIVGNSEYIGVGFDDGTIYLLQRDLLARRVSSDHESEEDENRSKLAEKLRRLRS